MKTALLIVVYPGTETFLSDLVRSLENQTTKDFDVLLVNDGMDEVTLMHEFKNLQTKVLSSVGSIAGNREVGINYAIEQGYDALVFCDADDFYEKNRVEHSLEMLQKYDIYANDLTLVDESGDVLLEKYLSKAMREEAKKLSLGIIREKNMLGLSNTAIRLKDLAPIRIPKEIKVVDWYLFTKLLSLVKTAYFDNKTTTYYRQHSQNIVGLKKFTVEQYRAQLEVKLLHYRNLSDDAIYKNLYEKYLPLRQLTDEQIESIIAKSDKELPLWWEEIDYSINNI